jgi:hypothetical protein
MDKGTVFYLSVTQGITNPQGKEPIAYYGKVYRIPRSEHGTIRQLEWEMKPDELLGGMGQDGEPVGGGVIERFEIYDRDSGDVWVMYRVPCQKR